MSIAVVESKDGLQWGKAEIVLGPTAEIDRQNDLNRAVVENGDLYQRWHTGQATGKSCIGYATAIDGKPWRRGSDKPVLSVERSGRRWR